MEQVTICLMARLLTPTCRSKFFVIFYVPVLILSIFAFCCCLNVLAIISLFPLLLFKDNTPYEKLFYWLVSGEPPQQYFTILFSSSMATIAFLKRM